MKHLRIPKRIVDSDKLDRVFGQSQNRIQDYDTLAIIRKRRGRNQNEETKTGKKLCEVTNVDFQ